MSSPARSAERPGLGAIVVSVGRWAIALALLFFIGRWLVRSWDEIQHIGLTFSMPRVAASIVLLGAYMAGRALVWHHLTLMLGTAIPLRRSNVDTDQIIPAVYLKRVTKDGFEDGLFAAWRSDPNFVLNLPQYAGATILIAGPDFGTGSSREHAVWALQNYGFKVVIGSRFGDIFRTNSGKAGLLVAVVNQKIIEELWDFVEEHPAAPITVDLIGRQITADGFHTEFEIDDYTRWRLMEGLDDIGLTLRHVDQIDEFEKRRAAHKPTTLPAKVANPS